MKPKVAAAIITGTMAKPSSPSVRFTALPAPTMIKAPKGMKNQPRSISTDLKKGMASSVASGGSPTSAMTAEALGRLLGDFKIIVVEPDGAIDEGEKQDHPNIWIAQIAPEEDRDGDAGQDHQPAHRRRAL